jgi:FKBP12-rapamycin complex-associated protein
MSPHKLSRVLGDISDRINQMATSVDGDVKMGCLVVIDELIDMACKDIEKKTIIQFFFTLQSLMKEASSNTDPELLEMSAKALGHLAKGGGRITAGFIESEMETFMQDWIKNPANHARRQIAVMCLRELAVNTPSLFFVHIDKFFEVIWESMCDPKLTVRRSSSEALEKCLLLISQRQQQSYKAIDLYEKALAAFSDKSSSSDMIHGALLVLDNMLQHAGKFMESRFQEAYQAVKKVRDSRDRLDRLSRPALLALLPHLAKFCERDVVEDCVGHLIKALQKNTEDRATAILALGEISKVIGDDLTADSKRLATIVHLILDALTAKRGKPFCVQALVCISMVAEAVGDQLSQHIPELLNQMFSNGLSQELVNCLHTLCEKIPGFVRLFQERLMHELSMILAGREYRAGGASLALTPQGGRKRTLSSGTGIMSSMGNFFSSSSSTTEDRSGFRRSSQQISSETIRLALKTLGTFNFGLDNLLPFACDCVVHYLDNDSPDTRREAVETCAKLLRKRSVQLVPITPGRFGGSSSDSVSGSSSDKSGETIEPLAGQVLERLLVTALADPDPSIRSTVLRMFVEEPRFDPFMEEVDNLQSLFVAMNDEKINVRRWAVTIIARLAGRNPHHVLPSLRRILLQLVAELQYTSATNVQALPGQTLAAAAREEEDSAVLLGDLIRHSGNLVRPYAPAVLHALLPHLLGQKRDAVVDQRMARRHVSSAVFSTLGALTVIGADTVRPQLYLLLPVVIDALLSTRPASELLVVVQTLGELAQSTGCCTQLYQEYPHLLNALLEILSSSADAALRVQLVKTLGILGAIDPFLHGLYVDRVAAEAELHAQAAVASAGRAAGRGGDAPQDGEPARSPELRANPGVVATMPIKTGGAEDMPASEQHVAAAIQELVTILRDLSLSGHHKAAQERLMHIAKWLGGDRIVPFLPQILPLVFEILRTRQRDVGITFGQLSQLVDIVRERIRPYLPEIVAVIMEHLRLSRSVQMEPSDYAGDSNSDHKALQGISGTVLERVLCVTRQLQEALGSAFELYLPEIVPQLLNVIREDRNRGQKERLATPAVLWTLMSMGKALFSFLYSIVPELVRLIEHRCQSSDQGFEVCRWALSFLEGLCEAGLDLSEYGCRIVHPLVRVLDRGARGGLLQQVRQEKKLKDHDFYEEVISALCSLVHSLGASYAVFVPTLNKVLMSRGADAPLIRTYNDLVSHVLKERPLAPPPLLASDRFPLRPEARSDRQAQRTTVNIRQPFEPHKLKPVWETSEQSTREDWIEWMRRFSLKLLEHSPSPALRWCHSLATMYEPLAQKLFNAACVSCWMRLDDKHQDSLVFALEQAFNSPNIHPEVLLQLLNLTEYMERYEQDLHIDIRVLGRQAMRANAYAKALHYKEQEFLAAPNAHPSLASCTEALISINNKLEQPEAAVGILEQAARSSLELKETWYEELGRWQEALEFYERKASAGADDSDHVLGRLRCLDALGEWETLSELATNHWETAVAGEKTMAAPASRGDEGESKGNERSDVDTRHEVTSLAARAALSLMQWDDLERIVEQGALDMSTHDGAFYHAALALHYEKTEEAQELINQARARLAGKMAALVGESYSRIYDYMVWAQRLLEMEEVVSHRCILHANGRDYSNEAVVNHLTNMHAIWHSRLNASSQDVKVYLKLMTTHAFVPPTMESLSTWLRFAGVCRKNGRVALSKKILYTLRQIGGAGGGPAPSDPWPEQVQPAITVRIPGHESERKANAPRGFTFLQNIVNKNLVRDENPRNESTALLHVRFEDAQHEWLALKKDDAIGQLEGLIRDAWVTRRPKRVSSFGLPLRDSANSVGGGGSGGVSGGAGGVGVVSSSVGGGGGGMASVRERDDAFSNLIVNCHLKLGEWKLARVEEQAREQRQEQGGQLRTAPIQLGMANEAVKEVLELFKTARDQGDRSSYDAWHAWALMNYRMVEHLADSEGDRPEKKSKLDRYLVAAVEGFFESIALCRRADAHGGRRADASVGGAAFPSGGGGSAPAQDSATASGGGGARALQDILRLLSLWFKHGARPAMADALKFGLRKVSIDTWLEVVPQLIARIHSAAQSELINDLLYLVGKEHPQALIYPLTVASTSANEKRKLAASDILAKMRLERPQLVDQALHVSTELIRVAILWHEMWHEGLEEASRLFFGDQNVAGMLDILEPLHEMVEKGPETLREVSFMQAYGRDLAEAREWCRQYHRSQRLVYINQAWDLYYHIFKRISKQLPQIDTLQLQYVSPMLLECHDLTLGVPGTYHAGRDIIRIKSFQPLVKVITSKQRPRRIKMNGNDGREYTFLLKGHEDLRLDERVMQLFGLVNALFTSNHDTHRLNLHVYQYAVVPLSNNCGVVEWVPDTDTLHALIKAYREPRKIPLNIEHGLMLKEASPKRPPDAADYDKLSLIQKMEVFATALDNTTGQDLCKMLWLRSPSSEEWLTRRTAYTRSLAVMSMVGYILGLGDRHPSNIMLERYTGRMLHIDFGDCFEVAMQREKFPEKVPFRLTRMMVNAMEVSGIEGNFRKVCEAVLDVLRENRDSMMTMLEAFVHDPLINHRLLTIPDGAPSEAIEEGDTGADALGPDDAGAGGEEKGDSSDDSDEDSEDGEGKPGTGAAEMGRIARANTVALATGHHANRNMGADGDDDDEPTEALNERAVEVIERVDEKLTGRDRLVTKAGEQLDVKEQVERLIVQAISHENLCQSYIGWW